MYTRAALERCIGQSVGQSRWFTIHQHRINAFANVTEDHQFIHIDAEKAASGPFGATIAHGFLTLSLLSAMLFDGGPQIEGEVMGVNYGMNKVRFLSPVRVGSRVRGNFTLHDVQTRENALDTILDVTVEIEGQTKPALVVEWITRHYFGET
ncbi:acyl dehydratase [Rhizobium petrolearium]|uniref:MaoC family dehydratase n=1 Tax=Neorhizobium petrolearium TaxID=515361 RepID=UPI001AE6C7C8|nr:MaoC family dehydratase [Neorhizobium petrolearium]MBP1845758.1 acyl dehydratase [Neorhizobium petrolearium]